MHTHSALYCCASYINTALLLLLFFSAQLQICLPQTQPCSPGLLLFAVTAIMTSSVKPSCNLFCISDCIAVVSASVTTLLHHHGTTGRGCSTAVQLEQDILLLLDQSALLLQICITVLLSCYVLQNYCFNCFTVGCVGWREVLVLNKLSAELLHSSNCSMEQTGATAPAALHCNPGHFCTYDPASAQGATWAPAS